MNIIRRLQRLSLRWQVAVGVAIGFIFLFSVFAYLSIRTIQRTTDVTFQERQNLALTTASSIDALINHALDTLVRSAELLESREAEGDSLDMEHTLQDVYHIMGTFNTLALVEVDEGRLWTYPTEVEAAALGLEQSPLIRQVLLTGEPAVGRAVFPGDRHPPVAVAAVPISGASGFSRKVLLGVLHLNHMKIELVPLPKASSSAQIIEVIDEQGNILASSEGRDVSGKDPHIFLPALKALVDGGRAGVFRHDVQGAPGHLVAYAPLHAVSGGVLVEQVQDIAMALPTDMRRTILVFGLVALAAVSLGAWAHARYVLRPIALLEAATRKIASGALDEPVQAQREDEIGMLARSFDAMRAQLKAAHEERLRWGQELEARVRARTQEVHQLLGKVMSAQEEERKRLARELHDDTAQTLASLLVTFRAVLDSLPPEEVQERELLAQALAQGASTLAEVRRAILDLRPSALDDLGLVSALRAYAEDRLGRAGVRMEFEVMGQERRLQPQAETALFRILQEAVTNIVKHAQASTARLRLEFGPQALLAVVEDDGRGFDAAAVLASPSAGRLGLDGMRERADLVGAELSLESHPGAGTRLQVRVPLEGGEASHG